SKPSSAAKSLTMSKNSSCGPAVTPTFNDSSLSASELSFEFALLFSASPSPQAVKTKVAKINVVSNNNNFFKFIPTFLSLVVLTTQHVAPLRHTHLTYILLLHLTDNIL